MQRIRRLVDALRQQLLDAHIVRGVVVLAEAHALQNEMHHRMAGGLCEKAGLLFVESAATTTDKYRYY